MYDENKEVQMVEQVPPDMPEPLVKKPVAQVIDHLRQALHQQGEMIAKLEVSLWPVLEMEKPVNQNSPPPEPRPELLVQQIESITRQVERHTALLSAIAKRLQV